MSRTRYQAARRSELDPRSPATADDDVAEFEMVAVAPWDLDRVDTAFSEAVSAVVARRDVRVALRVGRTGVRGLVIGARVGRSTARLAARGTRGGWRAARAHPRAAVGVAVVALVALGAVLVLRRSNAGSDESERHLQAVA